MKKKSLILCLVLIVLLCFTGCTDEEKEKAKSDFEATVTLIENNNNDIQSSIDSLQALIDSEELPLDMSTIDSATTAITEARGKILEIPEIPSKTEEIINVTNQLLNSSDCSETLSSLQQAYDNLNNSILQMKQVTNPSESFIVERLTGLPNIIALEAATEENDPNGQLNKQGGYTSAVFFSSDLIDQSTVFGKTIVERGTDGGGSIEVYANAEDANKRNDYLSAFDGGIFSSGSHTVVGTVVIRTSDNLTASQQKEMETNIYNSLIELK